MFYMSEQIQYAHMFLVIRSKQMNVVQYLKLLLSYSLKLLNSNLQMNYILPYFSQDNNMIRLAK
jgi:hypothetical protein